VDREVLWRAALCQAAVVAVFAAGLALALPSSFFEEWGWLAGPAVWLLCAAITARAVRLPLARTLACAIAAGAATVVGVIAGAHWLGLAVAVAAFAILCARFAAARTVAWS